MSEEAEKAAKRDMHEDHKKLCSRLGILENERKKVCPEWFEMGRVFQSLRGTSFMVTDKRIIAFNDCINVRIFVPSSKNVIYGSLSKVIDFCERTFFA